MTDHNKDINLEQIILGALILEGHTFNKISQIITPEMFAGTDEQDVAKTIWELQEDGKPVDLMILTRELIDNALISESLNIGYITGLTSKLDSSTNAEHYAYKLKELYIMRELGVFSQSVALSTFDRGEDPFKLLDSIQGKLDALNDIAQMGSRKANDDLTNRALAALRDDRQTINTGIDSLDGQFVGFERSDLWFLAARPGMGKTAMALNIMSYNVLLGLNVKFYSFEMSDIQLIHRCYSFLANIPYMKIKERNLSEDEFNHISHKALDYVRDNVEIIDNGVRSIDQMVSKCRADHAKQPLDMVIVDYLQIIPIQSKANRNEQIGYLTSKLKQLAKDCNCVILCLSQLNRKVEERPDKRPMLSDLRDSGSIEQDADGVVFLWRPEYYGIMEDADGNSFVGRALADFAKYRGGITGDKWMQSDLAHMRFV